ncbi:uncharacterized protein [Antedon mediterranea]|uniref:uncharacterized protein n=1 Tax=Antedon mediterranea TaxID=105859 RepID=UPI003AF5AE46
MIYIFLQFSDTMALFNMTHCIISLLGACLLVGSMPVSPTTDAPIQLNNVDDAKTAAERWERNIYDFYTSYINNHTALSATSIQSNNISKRVDDCILQYRTTAQSNLETRLVTLVKYSVNITTLIYIDAYTRTTLSNLDKTMEKFLKEDNVSVCNVIDDELAPPLCFESFETAVAEVKQKSEPLAVAYSLHMLRSAADAVYKLTSSSQLC